MNINELTDDAINKINADISSYYEKIGRVVVHSERIRNALIQAIVGAELGPCLELSDDEMEKVDELATNRLNQLQRELLNAPIPYVVSSFRKACDAYYAGKVDELVVITRLANLCCIINQKRNDITHSLWAIGWKTSEMTASASSFRFLKKSNEYLDIKLGTELDEIIQSAGVALNNITRVRWSTFTGRPLSFDDRSIPFL